MSDPVMPITICCWMTLGNSVVAASGNAGGCKASEFYASVNGLGMSKGPWRSVHPATHISFCGTVGAWRLRWHHEHLVHSMAVHVEDLEDVALRLDGLALAGDAAQRLHDKASEGLEILVLRAAQSEAGQGCPDALNLNHRVDEPGAIVAFLDLGPGTFLERGEFADKSLLWLAKLVTPTTAMRRCRCSGA